MPRKMTHTKIRRFAARLTAILVCLATPTASTAAALPEARERAIDNFVGQFVDFGMFDGTVLVDIGGEVVYRKSFGYANYEFGIAHQKNTRFRIASVSKALTDAAVAKMIEQDMFTRETPISRFLPNFPSADVITIGHILDHTSGISHTNRQSWGDGSISMSIDELVRRLAEAPLEFEPGTDSAYSNGGYAVLAKVMEIVADGSYAEVMRKTVLDPLGMHDSDHIADARAVIANMATGYEPGKVPGERRHTRFYAVETRPGGGSMFSTADDLLAFTRAIFREQFVPTAMRRDVMGLDDDGFLSQGRAPGFVSKLLFQPEDDIIVISLANNYSVASNWAVTIAGLASGKIDENPWPILNTVNPIIAHDDSRIGRYISSFGNFELAIDRSPMGYLLALDDVNNSHTALIPLQEGHYLQPQYFQICLQDADTRVITCRMLSGDERYTSTLTPVKR